MITKNCEDLLEGSLESCQGLVEEIVIVDNYSQDATRDIAKKYGAKIFLNKEPDFGKQRSYGLRKATGDWMLVLDSDEIISKELKREIKSVCSSQHSVISKSKKLTTDYRQPTTGYYIPFQNHFLGKPINYGGENYKMLRLFKRDSASISSALVHERFEIKKGKAGKLKLKIYHYSYRSLGQTYKKFTDYAIREARQKVKMGEKTSLRKIILYPIHMFWARFIKDKGYKDGLFRVPLDLGFAYMEFVTYLLLPFFRSGNNADSNAD